MSSNTANTISLSRRGFASAAVGALGALTLTGLGGRALAADAATSAAKDASAAKDGSAAGDAVGGVVQNADGSYTVTDAMGRKVTFEEPPQRVAMTIMPLPSIFYAVFGDTDMIVGCNPSTITAYESSVLKDMYPSLASASTGWCGTDFSVNVEELLTLKPDVVFQWTSQPDSITSMESVGLKVVALRYGSLDQLWDCLNLLGSIFQVQDRIDFLTDYFKRKTEEVTSLTSTVPEDEWPSIIELSSESKITAKGFMSYWVDGAGTKNPAAAELGQDSTDTTLDVDMEQMLVWNPDIIWIGNFTSIMPSDLYENKIDGQDWSMVKAVQNRQVYKIPIGEYRWDPPSMDSPLTLKWMASIAHPELFEGLDLAADVRQYYKDVYGYDVSDEQLDAILNHTQD